MNRIHKINWKRMKMLWKWINIENALFILYQRNHIGFPLHSSVLLLLFHAIYLYISLHVKWFGEIEKNKLVSRKPFESFEGNKKQYFSAPMGGGIVWARNLHVNLWWTWKLTNFKAMTRARDDFFLHYFWKANKNS